MILNWILGVLFAFSPILVKSWTFYQKLEWLPAWLLVLIGLGFLVFAAWQTRILIRNKISPRELIFASIMALGPVIFLTWFLLFLSLPLFPIVRILLWTGNLYMLFLGIWYLLLARKNP